MPAFGLTPQQEIIFSIVSYSLCSGSLVLVNKLTLHYLPFPSLVVTVQLVACIIMIYTANALGKIKVDPIEWECVKPYLLYTVFFSSAVYCNMRSLNISNVETVIVFRALSPALVSFMDALCLGREWPSKRSWVGLMTLVLGAYKYASFDEQFQNQGPSAYYWPTAYTVAIALEMVCVTMCESLDWIGLDWIGLDWIGLFYIISYI
jgi:drug/metabolite transporter (DMT)-like permease